MKHRSRRCWPPAEKPSSTCPRGIPRGSQDGTVRHRETRPTESHHGRCARLRPAGHQDQRLRAVLTVVVLVVLYYNPPLDQELDKTAVALLLVGLLALTGLHHSGVRGHRTQDAADPHRDHVPDDCRPPVLGALLRVVFDAVKLGQQRQSAGGPAGPGGSVGPLSGTVDGEIPPADRVPADVVVIVP